MSAPEPAPPRPIPAWRSSRAWATLLIVAVLGVALDLWTKWLAFQRIAGRPVIVDRERVLAGGLRDIVPPHEPVQVVPYALDLTLVLNPGAVFGVGPGRRWFFIVFTMLAMSFGVWIFATWTHARARWAHIGIGLVLAGGLGNLYDRLRFGCVRDFLRPLPDVHLPFGLSWPGGATDIWPWVSNVADALLLIGIGILIITLWRGEDRSRASSRAGGDPPVPHG